MATKHKPKWGHQGRYLLSDDGILIYSDEEIHRLATTFEIIGEDQIEELRMRLEGSANIYRIHHNNNDAAPRPGEMKAAIEEIDKLVTQLTDRLENIDDWTWRYLWHHERSLDRFHVLKGIPEETTVEKTEFGHTITRFPDNRGGMYISCIGQKEHFESLKILKNYCNAAIELIPPDKGARRKSEGLRMWAINMLSLWTELLDREFTIIRHKGEPVSDAARFCCEAFKTVDASVPQSLVITTLEQVKLYKNKKRIPRNAP